jgi:LPS-assembly lipoprotein
MVVLGETKESTIGSCQGRIAGRRQRVCVLAVVAVLVVAGCGWRPLYERPSASPTSGGAGAALAQIAIDPVAPEENIDPLSGGSNDALYNSRAAQLLQNYLTNALNPYGAPSPALYHLAIQLRQRTRSAASLGNGQSTREDLIMTAEYQLNDAKGEPVMKDVASIVTSYDILREPFSDLSSRRDAQQRAAQELAQAIQTRLAVFLRK